MLPDSNTEHSKQSLTSTLHTALWDTNTNSSKLTLHVTVPLLQLQHKPSLTLALSQSVGQHVLAQPWPLTLCFPLQESQ
jgi:hypothetical protein